MQFDIFEAIATVKEHLGSSGDITVSTLEYGIAFTLSVTHKGQLLCKRFILSDNDLQSQHRAQMVQIRFNHSLHELQLAIAQIYTNPEENHNAI